MYVFIAIIYVSRQHKVSPFHRASDNTSLHIILCLLINIDYTFDLITVQIITVSVLKHCIMVYVHTYSSLPSMIYLSVAVGSFYL